MNYYNEFDDETAWWLKGLIDAGLIPKGYVDTRSIVDVDPDELKGYSQCHFFAGIGGWNRALALANVPEDFHIWTGSCPCQPFSCAGAKKGLEDERNLWKYFYELIKENRPPVVVGEQVASAISYGWSDIVANDLESQGYSFGSAVLAASMLGSPHIRKRLYWGGIREDILENPDSLRQIRWLPMGNSTGSFGQLQEYDKECLSSRECFWSDSDWVEGTNGKSFTLQHGVFPLVNGIPNRVVKCRGYGNAIVPQVGAFFVKALLNFNY